jgi:hypothetical protein
MFAMGAEFPSHPLACALRRVFAVDLLVVDQGWLAEHRSQLEALTSMLEPKYSDGAVAIFALQPSLAECPPMRLEVHPR